MGDEREREDMRGREKRAGGRREKRDTVSTTMSSLGPLNPFLAKMSLI